MRAGGMRRHRALHLSWGLYVWYRALDGNVKATHRHVDVETRR